jgi:hypothetical protein
LRSKKGVLGVADDEDFITLSKQFETLTKELTGTQDPDTRKRLLAELRLLLRRLDRDQS